MEGTWTHEGDILGAGPHTSSVASPLRSVSTGQDINDEAHPVVSQAEGVISIWPCYHIPRRLCCSVTGSGVGSGVHEKNIISDKLAEAQIRACFVMVLEISNSQLPDEYEYSCD
jgi:hypothetical protein